MKKKIIKYIIIIMLLIIVTLLSTNIYVKLSTKNRIIDDYTNLNNIDCILILGAGVRNNRPSLMLEDRLQKGLELYNNNVSSKIIVSGDHGRKDYDEVNIMKEFLIENNVSSSDIFMDHAGFSTYDSIYRAKEIFKTKKIVIISQEYHLYRALFIADKLGLEAYGVKAEPKEYYGDAYREIREVIARIKDFFKVIIKPKPTYLGETIPVTGDGDITNDK